MPNDQPQTAERQPAVNSRFSKEENAQLVSYLEYYEHIETELNDRLTTALSDHPVLGEIIAAQTDDQRVAQQNESRKIQRAAVYGGEWDAYAKYLRGQGVMYAKMQLEFEDWITVTQRFKHVLIELVDSDPPKGPSVIDVLKGAELLSHFALSVIAGSYLDEKNRQIRQEKEAKEQLLQEVSEQRQRLNAIVQHSSDHIIVIDAEGKIESINHVAEGFSMDQIVGANLFALQPESDRSRVEIIVNEVLNKGEADFYDVDVASPNGVKRFANSVGPIRNDDGQITGAVIVSRDITVRKKAEEHLERTLQELKRVQERFDLAIEGSSAGIWDWDLKTDEVFYSTRFKSLLGLKDEEMENRFEAFQELLHPDDKKKVFEQISQTLNEDTPFDAVYRLRHKSGKYRWFISRGKVLREADGTPYRMAGSIANIDDQKRLESELRELNDTLEKKVEKRTARLKEINEELEGFSYTVSHDLRAPLRAIDGFSKILSRKLEGSLDEDQQHYLDVIIENVGRMGVLIDDLLEFSRMGRKERKNAAFRMESLINQVMDELHQVHPAQQVDFQNKVSAEVHGDRDMIKLVLLNLLGNALKFSSTREKAKISVHHEEVELEHCFTIRDNGVGYDEEYADKLFHIFQRLHTEDEFEGTGVGLAIVQRIIHRHGGRVSSRSTDEGAEFSFTLPKNPI